MADVINDAKGVASTFSSWDSCMSKTYCKWPVIAAIIIGSLIVLSVLWCIFSCLCCGISLCTACGKCLTCGGCCGACGRGGGGRRKDPEYHPMPPTPTPYQGYQPQSAPMKYNHNTGPQFATFDTGNKRSANNIHEDSLPSMPSWDQAQTRRVEDHSQPAQRGSAMEMERMLPSHSHQNNIPTSPTHDHNPYSNDTQAYASDLGAQRLDTTHQQHTGHGAANDYYDPPSQPLSPAPTYYSTVPAGSAMAQSQQHHDRFSPIQEHHQVNRFANNNSSNTNFYAHNDRSMTSSVAPYPSSRESTQFTSPQSYTPYSSPPPVEQHNTGSGARPPSLLQVGRKPVAGSYREV